MIELPEALVIARQMTAELRGRRIETGVRGNAPHKFAFYNRPPEEYEAILRGRTMGAAAAQGCCVVAAVEPGHALQLGGGGERILYHRGESTLPAKHQLMLRFEDGSCVSVTVQGWGCAQLLGPAEIAAQAGETRVSPLSDAFTPAYFEGLFGDLAPDDSRSVKFFVISRPGVWGVGNGYLQDILFRAGIHPRRRASSLAADERQALYEAIRYTLSRAAECDGRDTERDLYNRPGGYRRILDSRAAGQPCPGCGALIEKISFLGGASYFCPRCQV